MEVGYSMSMCKRGGGRRERGEGQNTNSTQNNTIQHHCEVIPAQTHTLLSRLHVANNDPEIDQETLLISFS
jgi:hypothetical protein